MYSTMNHQQCPCTSKMPLLHVTAYILSGYKKQKNKQDWYKHSPKQLYHFSLFEQNDRVGYGISDIRSIKVLSGGQHAYCGAEYGVAELQQELFDTLQVKGLGVECTDTEQYLMGYMDKIATFSLGLHKATKQGNMTLINQIRVNASSQEEHAVQLIKTHLNITENIKYRSLRSGYQTVYLNIRKQSVVHEQALPYFIARLAHVRSKVLPLVCSTAAARLQLDKIHTSDDGERLWRFLQLGSKVVKGPADKFDVYSGAVLSIVQIMSSSTSKEQYVDEILQIMDKYDAWCAGTDMSAWVCGLRGLPLPLAPTKAYLHGMMDTAGGVSIQVNSDLTYPRYNIQYKMQITGQSRLKQVHQVSAALELGVFETLRKSTGNLQYICRVHNPKAVLRVVQYAQQDRGSYPFIRQEYFDTVRGICNLFIRGEHKSEEGQQELKDMQNTLIGFKVE